MKFEKDFFKKPVGGDFSSKSFKENDKETSSLKIGKRNKLKTDKPEYSANKITTQNEDKPQNQPKKVYKNVNISLRMDEITANKLEETVKHFEKLNMHSYAEDARNLINNIVKDRFTVAVVGEFSKGKSTFINNLFQKDVLPVGNTPTTALLTKVMYNSKEALVISDGKNQRKAFPLSQKSWEGYTAALDGNDPSGVAFVGLDDPWLKHGIEIIDTPGAGDLEANRAALIGDALKASDGAIITISAEVAMSMSEKLFIEERLISKKTPFLMLIITKLDRIDEKQRKGVVEFIKQKLELWNINVPVYIPYDVNIPGGEYVNITGMDKVKNQIDSWIVSPERVRLTCEWVGERAKAIIATAMSELGENLIIAKSNDSKRDELIDRKKELLEKAKIEWEELRLSMMERSNDTYKKLMSKTGDFEKTVVDKLTHELSHSPNPQKWWAEDYPYRLKIELSNFSASIENYVSKKINDDARWFNSNLDKSFKTNILFSAEKYESSASLVCAEGFQGELSLRDLTAARTVSRIGVSALSIVGFMACSTIGIPPIIGSTGITTGGTVVSELLFKKKIDSQRNIVKEEIEKNVPLTINKATIHTEARLKNMYNDILKEAEKLEKSWMETQSAAISASIDKNVTETNVEKLSEAIYILEKQLENWEVIA